MKPGLSCERCGTAMNHQATKLREAITAEEVEASRVSGGILIVVFACPNCGWIASRREDADA